MWMMTYWGFRADDNGERSSKEPEGELDDDCLLNTADFAISHGLN